MDPVIVELLGRLAVAWLVPLIELLTGHGTDGVVIMLSLVVTVVLVWRRSGKGKVARNPMPVHAIWFLIVTIMLVQICCVIIRSFYDDETVYVQGPGGKKHVTEHAFNIDASPGELRMEARTISVVMPCAQEQYIWKTIKSIYLQTPRYVLKEIIIIDDGSDPPLSKSGFTPGACREWLIKLLRNDKTQGVIASRKMGGDHATGDIIVFLDCHVATQPYWYSSFQHLISDSYRRMVVPQIVPLDVDTWTDGSTHGSYDHGLGKYYLTFDADFKWYESDDRNVAVLSGGIYGMSRLWWMQTGGVDEHMLGWGGENLDQSLRCWLCGGDIMVAKESRIAHMWRTGSDHRTLPGYKRVGNSKKNRARAVYGWYGDFADKLAQYPYFAHHRKEWVGDLSNFQQVKDRLSGCRPFAWFLRRFKDLYEDGGLVPDEIFMLKEGASGKCLRYQRNAGTSSDGKGTASLEECDYKDHRFYWHHANKDSRNKGKCCSGLKAWNTDQCITDVGTDHIRTTVCEVSGKNADQDWVVEKGRMINPMSKGNHLCIGPHTTEVLKRQSGQLVLLGCRDGFNNSYNWETLNSMMPLEGQLYRKAQREYPHLFGKLGVQKKALAIPPLPQACIKPADKNATCVQIFANDGRCLDEGGLLTTAKKYCSQYQLLGMCPTCPVDGRVRGIKSVVNGRCFDTMDDHYNETWDLEGCTPEEDTPAGGDVTQVFTRKGSTLCLSDTAKSAGTACFEFKVIEPAAPAVIT
mmetsp:Transcript_44527/g.83521  ORF Transcript_44527/g.83521 Transcript_44527/m.83521 type:complete len:747 (+) Transcript_44527:170-2410(+)